MYNFKRKGYTKKQTTRKINMRIRSRKLIFRVIFAVVFVSLTILGVNKFVKGTEDSMATACRPDATGINDAVCLQDMNDSVKASMDIEVPYALVDNRDGKPYQVSKLNDGNVWMTQNLALGTTTSTTALSAVDTDISMDSTFKTLPVAEARVDSDYYTVQDGFIEGGEKYIIFGGQGAPRDIVRDYGSGHYRIGNAYPWTIATAQTANYVEQTDQTGINPTPSDSICPAGWKLPSQDDYNDLLATYNLLLLDEQAGTEGSETTSAALRAAPFFFIRSFPYLLGTEGHYWTSNTSIKTDGARSLSYYVANIFFLNKDEAGASYRTDDISGVADAVRCVARPDSSFSFTLSYNLNGTSGSVEGSTKTSSHKQVDMIVSDAEPSWAHHRFLGWANSASATVPDYEGGDVVALGGDKTLYAVWEVVVSDQEVSFEESAVSKTYGDSNFTYLATTTGGGTITYSSDNTDVAEVEADTGLVTIKGAGTVTITATASATEFYREGTATYVLTIGKKTSTTPEEISIVKNGYVTDELSTVTLDTLGLVWSDNTEKIEEGLIRYAVRYTENGDTNNYTTEDFEISVRGERRVYLVTDGDGQTYVLKGEQESIGFKVNANYSLFEEGGMVCIDGILLDPEYYTTEADEDDFMTITILGDYLETLDVGKHDLLIFFNDGGKAEGSFVVEEKEENKEEEMIPVPNTGRINNDGRNAMADVLIFMLPGGVVVMMLIGRYIHQVKKTHLKFEW